MPQGQGRSVSETHPLPMRLDAFRAVCVSAYPKHVRWSRLFPGHGARKCHEHGQDEKA